MIEGLESEKNLVESVEIRSTSSLWRIDGSGPLPALEDLG
jgi:hypothetical protein